MTRDLTGLVRRSLDDYADTLAAADHLGQPQDRVRLHAAAKTLVVWPRRWAVPLAAAAASVLVAVALLTFAQQHRATDQTTALVGAPTVETTFAGLTLPHPATWASVPEDGQSDGDSSILGYLTTQTPGRQCATSGANAGETDCQPPVKVLQPDGVLVTIVLYSLGGGDPSPNGTVAGRPATLTKGTASTQPGFCPTGASSFSSAYITVPSDSVPKHIRVTGCFGEAASQGARPAFDAMLQNATYRRVG